MLLLNSLDCSTLPCMLLKGGPTDTGNSHQHLKCSIPVRSRCAGRHAQTQHSSPTIQSPFQSPSWLLWADPHTHTQHTDTQCAAVAGTTEMGNPFMVRQSYLPHEIHWGHTFQSIIGGASQGADALHGGHDPVPALTRGVDKCSGWAVSSCNLIMCWGVEPPGGCMV